MRKSNKKTKVTKVRCDRSTTLLLTDYDAEGAYDQLGLDAFLGAEVAISALDGTLFTVDGQVALIALIRGSAADGHGIHIGWGDGYSFADLYLGDHVNMNVARLIVQGIGIKTTEVELKALGFAVEHDDLDNLTDEELAALVPTNSPADSVSDSFNNNNNS